MTTSTVSGKEQSQHATDIDMGSGVSLWDEGVHLLSTKTRETRLPELKSQLTDF